MSAIDTGIDNRLLNPQQQETLLSLARDSIVHGLGHRNPPEIDVDAFEPELREQGASFVTLHKHGKLRGCIGALEAYQPLVADVAEHAHAAAFSDPRFPPLAPEEFDDLEISVSVLGRPELLEFTDEADLLSRLRPGIDGLILEEGARRGTFLPSVWESLPEPTEFLRNLKLKAGIYDPDYWSDTIRIYRYTTQSFSSNA